MALGKFGKLTDTLLQERYEKDIKYIKIYDQYRPNYNQTAITPKFYSKYEHSEIDEVDPLILEKIHESKDLDARQKREWPETSNQLYGWWSVPLVKIDRNDPRFYFPRVNSEITTYGMKAMQHRKG
ncbi:unnamed protein product [Ceutorhynchus assimilis]|uniref:Uncharacterized protein n=1 Tax=Ceutorhynchus assimilis TaxID=467358 RepID=A0A9N9QSV2_9CUCU|nr:unnamed protein product [Ceutorhynchus assimilis]